MLILHLPNISLKYNIDFIIFACSYGWVGGGGGAVELLTSHEHFQLFVIELHLSLGDQAAFSTLPHRVYKTHPGQRHLLPAALITETPPTPPTVVLENKQEWHQDKAKSQVIGTVPF